MPATAARTAPASRRSSAILAHPVRPAGRGVAVSAARADAVRDEPAERPIQVGVVSDTHLPQYGRALPRALVEALRATEVATILHLGDMTGTEVPELFEVIAPFDGVAGNNDGPALVERFGRRRVITLGGLRIGMTHGDLGPSSWTTPQRAAATFRADEVDIVLYGHSHVPRIERLPDSRWLVNPGSPTAKRRQPRYTWALLRIEGGVLQAPTIQAFDDRSP